MEAAAVSDAMYTQSVGSLLLGANQMGTLDVVPPRAQRRWRVRPDRYSSRLVGRLGARGL